MVGLELNSKNSGLDLDCKIWQSAHLCQTWARFCCKAWGGQLGVKPI